MATTGVAAIVGSTIGDIGTTGDANSFKVTLAAGTTYQGGHSGEGTLQRPVKLSLLDSSGNQLIGDFGDGDSGSGPAGLNDRFTYTGPHVGDLLSRRQADSSGTGAYTASATALSTTLAPVLTTVASFNGSDGEYPQSSLIADANGDLFGTTPDGGANGDGAVFEIVNNGTLAAPNYASTPTTLGQFQRQQRLKSRWAALLLTPTAICSARQSTAGRMATARYSRSSITTATELRERPHNPG